MAQSKGRRYNYEAMFLVSPTVAAELNSAVEHINEILGRGDAEVLAMKKWDERRLAYEIDKNRRGVYFLVYFACDPVRIEDIDRGCNLSEKILRSMIVRADHLTEEEIRAQDGRQQLADEARLRGSEQPAEQPAG